MDTNFFATVIINADDFGHNPGVSKGIIEAYRHGIVTSTTILANLISSDESFEAKNESGLSKPKLGFGVHLNATFGPPLLNELFTNHPFDRPFRNTNLPEEWKGGVWKDWFLKYDEKKIKLEFEAQIQKAISLCKQIDHLDTHNSISGYMPIKRVFYELAKKYNLPIRPAATTSEVPKFGGKFTNLNFFIKEARKLGLKTANKVVMKYF